MGGIEYMIKFYQKEVGITILKNFKLKTNCSLRAIINEECEKTLKNLHLHEYHYLTDTYKDFDFTMTLSSDIPSKPKKSVTIGGRVEEYLRKKEINLESAERIFVKLKLQKNTNPEIGITLF